jgi:outer membrane protein
VRGAFVVPTGALTVAVFCAALVMLVSPVPAQAESLLESLSDAYNYSPQLDAQRAQLRATDEDVARANSGYRPSISATFDAGRQRTRVQPNFGTAGTTSARGYSVQLVQPIFRGFRTTSAVSAAEASVRAGREQLRQVEQQVLLEAVTAYASVLQDQAIVKFNQLNTAFLTTQLNANRERYKVKELTQTDVAQSEARRALGLSDLELAIANLKSSNAEYERVVGHPPNNLVETSTSPAQLPKTLPEAISIGTAESPQVISALYQEQAARYQIDETRGELLPDAQVEATYSGRYDSSRQNDETETASIVGRVNVPIYAAGGEVYARVRKAKQEHLQRIQQIEQARAAAKALVVQQWSQLQGARAQREANLAQIKSSKTAVDGVKAEEKVGNRTITEILDAQRELLQAQIQLERTKRNILVGAYGTISAIGRLSLSELGTTAPVYDPEAHYAETQNRWIGTDITLDDPKSDPFDVKAKR